MFSICRCGRANCTDPKVKCECAATDSNGAATLQSVWKYLFTSNTNNTTTTTTTSDSSSDSSSEEAEAAGAVGSGSGGGALPPDVQMHCCSATCCEDAQNLTGVKQCSGSGGGGSSSDGSSDSGSGSSGQ
jgi:hypothetical protein